MSYLRPIRKDELTTWLLENGPEDAGYWDVDAPALAQKLIDKFDILTYSNTPT